LIGKILHSIKIHVALITAALINGCLYFHILHRSQPVLRWYRLQYLIDHCSSRGCFCEDFTL